MATTKPKGNQLCAECGEFVVSLVRDTGWCKSCSGSYHRNQTVCYKCGRSKNPATGVCDYCVTEHYLAVNADHLEHYIAQGMSLSKALQALRTEVKPRCSSCGGLIDHSRRDAVFCSKLKRCRSAKRRYTYLYQDKGMSKAQALAQILEEIN